MWQTPLVMHAKIAALLTSEQYARSRDTLHRMLGKRVQRFWILQSIANSTEDFDAVQPSLEIGEPGIGLEFESKDHCAVGIRADNAIVANPERIDSGDDPEFTAHNISEWSHCLPFISTSLIRVDAFVDLDEYPHGIIGGLRLSFSDNRTLIVDYRRFRGPNESYLDHRVRFADDESIETFWQVAGWLPSEAT